jgi:tripartite-type tricarboxylate transporter receptor subunit TctC
VEQARAEIEIAPLQAAGSTPDVLARLVAEQLSAQLGQPVVADNRAGAGRTIAIRALAAAEPDGHTLLLGTTGGLAINPALYRHLDLPVSRNFVPVALIAMIPDIKRKQWGFRVVPSTDITPKINYFCFVNGLATSCA